MDSKPPSLSASGLAPRRTIDIHRAVAHVRLLAGFSVLVVGWLTFCHPGRFPRPYESPGHCFYTNISHPQNICVRGNSSSHAGYIGLAEDTESEPRRSFFWFFEAEEHAENAPIMQVGPLTPCFLLTFGGGPGASAMLQTFTGQGPCLITADDIKPNPNPITERFNLLALEHPIGTGFSYGRMTNNSYDAALDVYDFLQKFFAVFPNLSKNRFIISSESYGGLYIPTIAAFIHKQNKILARTKRTGAVHINLDSLISANPASLVGCFVAFPLVTPYRCVLTDIYDDPTCTEFYGVLPTCLEAIEASLQDTSMSRKAMATRQAAEDLCLSLVRGNMHGTFVYDIRRKCLSENTLDCMPHFAWLDNFFRNGDMRHALGVSPFANFSALTPQVADGFDKTGDILLPVHLLYESLISEGIRVLHLAGAQDAQRPWPGTISFLKLLHTPFQDAFRNAADVPWPPANPDMASVRSVGAGAGNMTYILVSAAGHFLSQDEPALFKEIMERWIDNVPFI
ncbi:Alpha/Beta hydrolase protein [Mycena galopus ATCC 62051]|nr:Alpha/Beta hydrolase protein [Mycena galopus ATCC 62051]